jgi:hypothetical protein
MGSTPRSPQRATRQLRSGPEDAPGAILSVSPLLGCVRLGPPPEKSLNFGDGGDDANRMAKRICLIAVRV